MLCGEQEQKIRSYFTTEVHQNMTHHIISTGRKLEPKFIRVLIILIKLLGSLDVFLDYSNLNCLVRSWLRRFFGNVKMFSMCQCLYYYISKFDMMCVNV